MKSALHSGLVSSAIAITLILVSAHSALAISENDYANEYNQKIYQPFLKSTDHHESFTFQSADGKYELSGVKFINPKPTQGFVVVLNGQSEPWLKYLEVFYDLYHKGYSIYSYDHRGQGLSPHLGPSKKPQIGHVDHFIEYTRDLNQFIEKIVKPQNQNQEKLFLLAHSMGGAIATEYLELYTSPFKAVALSAPMFQINTKPYPEKVARAIVFLAKSIGLGKKYALGKHNFDFNSPFEKNIITSSEPRWNMGINIFKNFDQTTIGGPSSGWVNESLRETKSIRKNASNVTAKILLLQAGRDQLVVNSAQTNACAEMKNCTLIADDFADSQHEILMENDHIRDLAMKKIEEFFQK